MRRTDCQSAARHEDDTVSFSDRPFAPPLDVVIDLPCPPSVNRTRKVDWASLPKIAAWKNKADVHVLLSRHRQPRQEPLHRFEVIITLSESHTKVDLDNPIKSLIDYLRRIEVIEDDAPQNMRRITVQWGEAPEGCRVMVRPIA